MVKKSYLLTAKGRKRNCVDFEALQILIKQCYTISIRPLYLLNLSFHYFSAYFLQEEFEFSTNMKQNLQDKPSLLFLSLQQQKRSLHPGQQNHK